MITAEELDKVSIDQLRRRGSLKWTMFPGTIGAFVAEMDYGMAPAIEAALHDAIDINMTGYLPPKLVDELGQACSRWQSDQYGWNVPSDRIRPLPDVLSGLEVVVQHFMKPGGKVVMPTPAYMPFLEIPPLFDREIIQVPMPIENGHHVMDLDGLEAAFQAGGELLVLCNPYNPLGRVFTRDELEALCAIVERHNGRVFSDEIHAPLVFAPNHHVPYASISEAAASHTVTATSASKAWNLPGLKTAQLILCNDADAARWPEICGMVEHRASNMGVIANVAAYNDSREWQTDVLAYLDGNRTLLHDLLAEQIPDMPCTTPEGTYIAWLDARQLGIDGSAADFFRDKAKVALTDGIACGEAGRGHLRFVFATTRPIIEQAVQQMAAALKNR